MHCFLYKMLLNTCKFITSISICKTGNKWLLQTDMQCLIWLLVDTKWLKKYWLLSNNFITRQYRKINCNWTCNILHNQPITCWICSTLCPTYCCNTIDTTAINQWTQITHWLQHSKVIARSLNTEMEQSWKHSCL